jgi:Domain of unknown function (DUF6362)
MLEPHWTPKMVAVYVEEAADTLRRLPNRRAGGYVSAWPEIVRDYWEAFGWHDAEVRPIPPSPKAVDRMDEALAWLAWLEPGERQLVWLRAEGLPWKRITHRLGIGRTTAWHRWTVALLKITTRLNAAAEHNRSNTKVLNRSGKLSVQSR